MPYDGYYITGKLLFMSFILMKIEQIWRDWLLVLY